jgi:hypothetical protein
MLRNRPTVDKWKAPLASEPNPYNMAVFYGRAYRENEQDGQSSNSCEKVTSVDNKPFLRIG